MKILPRQILPRQIRVCGGQGMADTRLDDGRFYDRISWRQILALADDPPSRPKVRGAWIIPSAHHGPDARTHEVQRERGRYVLLVADVDEGNLDLDAVADALEAALGGQHEALIYATRSATEGARRWRLLLPMTVEIDYWQWSPVMERFGEALMAAGVVPDAAIRRPAQFSYLPNRGAFYEAMAISGPHFDPTRWLPDPADRPEEPEAAPEDIEPPHPKGGIIGAFNRMHDIPELLGRYGYAHAGDRSGNWRSRYQCSWPRSACATRDFGGYWVSLSESDAKAGLGRAARGEHDGARHGDAFDLFTHYEHGGDAKAALAAAKAEVRAACLAAIGGSPGPYPCQIRPSVAATLERILHLKGTDQ